ncbi:MAG: T9SS type A sorting domain-containing protein [Bacteroidetes bacterium]|nr:T9SS type A sorting domain-containing protein [Bacteroidota bacterium]
MNRLIVTILIAVAILCSTLAYSQTVTDIDGNVYQTVRIGTQTWLKENLKATHYRNGDAIPEVQDSVLWVAQKTGAWCNNENLPANGDIYGRLYNWYVVNDPRNIAPQGWHIPSDAEWKKLEIFLGMPPQVANLADYRGTKEANALKLADTTTYWTLDCCPAPGLSKNKGTNSSGFSALGSGYRIYLNAGGHYTSFQAPTGNAQFWSSTLQNDSTAWLRHLCTYHEDIYRSPWPLQNGSSIRLIQDTALVLDLEKRGNNQMDIYPNPAKSYFNVVLNNVGNSQLQIFNVVGELVLQSELNENRNLVSIENLSKGVYIVKLADRDFSTIRMLLKE